MARELRANPVHIDASPEQVWATLTDFESFPRWNPFIRRATGRIVPGGKIKIQLRIYGRTLMPLSPTVIMVEPPNELRWLAKNGPSGVFDVERFFIIEPAPEGGVTFRQGEDCSGFMAPFFLALGLESRILRGYERLNRALKKRSERLAAAAGTEPAPAAESASPSLDNRN